MKLLGQPFVPGNFSWWRYVQTYGRPHCILILHGSTLLEWCKNFINHNSYPYCCHLYNSCNLDLSVLLLFLSLLVSLVSLYVSCSSFLCISFLAGILPALSVSLNLWVPLPVILSVSVPLPKLFQYFNFSTYHLSVTLSHFQCGYILFIDISPIFLFLPFFHSYSSLLIDLCPIFLPSMPFPKLSQSFIDISLQFPKLFQSFIDFCPIFLSLCPTSTSLLIGLCPICLSIEPLHIFVIKCTFNPLAVVG